jgi:hypothetical protein
MNAQTVTMDGMTYGMDEMGQVKWATYSGETDEPKPDIPPECWHTQAFNAEQAHAALVALCRGS